MKSTAPSPPPRPASTPATSPEASPAASAPERPHVGRWAYEFATGRWHWSPEVVAMWDVGMGDDTSAEDVLARIHPDDRDQIAARLETSLRDGTGLAGQGRMRSDSHGERIYTFLGDLLPGPDGRPAWLQGYSVDVTEEVRSATREAVDAATRHRQAIEQVKGALMVTYRVDEGTAFAILRKRSNESNVKIHDLAERAARAMSHGGAPVGGVGASMMEILEAATVAD